MLHVILLESPHTEAAQAIEKHFPGHMSCHFKLNPTTYFVRGNSTEDIAARVGLGAGAWKVGVSAQGVVVALQGRYCGFASTALWEWVDNPPNINSVRH